MIVEESKLIDHCGEVVPTEYEGETCVRGSQGIPGKHTGEAVKLFAMSSNPNIRAEDLRSFVESN